VTQLPPASQDLDRDRLRAEGGAGETVAAGDREAAAERPDGAWSGGPVTPVDGRGVVGKGTGRIGVGADRT